MKMTTCQVSVDPNQIKSTLESVGYKLMDFGNHWRTSALYRGGDNSTSIRIYKNTGVWTDFVSGSQSFPLEKLLQLTVSGDKKKLNKILDSLNKSEDFFYEPKQLIEMERIYPDSILEKLFPNYSFYTKKNYKESTLKFYKTGFAGEGKMYRRMVFPIYNENSQIIGFSGRKIDNFEKIPKWKHLGQRKNWIYPAHIPAVKTVDSWIKEKEEVILVESIGDSMALYENNIPNNIVTFGLGVSPAIISYLNSFQLKKIIISTNNDFESSINHGYNGAIKILLSLIKYFNFDQIEIRLPPQSYNDFSDAHQDKYNLQSWRNQEIDRKKYIENLKYYVHNHKTIFKQKDVESLMKILNHYD